MTTNRRAAAPPTGREAETAWLIERGQPEKQAPTVWWADRKRWGLTYMDDWTDDAYKAFRFPTREAAEEVIAAKFTPPAPTSRGGPTARAVEHGFIAAPPTGREAGPGLARKGHSVPDCPRRGCAVYNCLCRCHEPGR